MIVFCGVLRCTVRWLIPKLEDFCVVMISLVVKEMIPLILKEMIPLLLKEMIPLLLAALDPRHTYFELLSRLRSAKIFQRNVALNSSCFF